MASSGLLSTSNQYVKYWIEIIQNWQDPANNVSNVTVKVWAKRTNQNYTTSGTGSVYLRVEQGNKSIYSNTKTSQISITSSSAVYHEWTGNIEHNAAGEQYVQAFASINISGGILSSNEQGYQMGLSTIPRASSFTINKTSCELGTPFTVSISRAANTFTHAVYYKIGNETRYLQQWNNTSVSTSATPPVTDATYMTKATSMVITVYVETYSGSSKIGTASKTLTLTVPASVVPTISSVTATLVAGTWSKYIKGKSKVKLTANGVGGAYGSTITSVKFEGGGYSNTDTASPWEYTTGLLNTAGNNVLTATVTDSRGRTNKATVTVVVTDYYSPNFIDAWCVRCLSDGATDLNGTYAKILINLNYDKVGGSNTHVVKYRYRVVGGAWSAYINVTNNVVTKPIAGFSTDLTYEVELAGADYFTSITPKIVILQTAVFPVDFLKGNKGVAFGKAAELDDTVDFNYKTKFRKPILDEFEHIYNFGISTKRTDSSHYARIQSDVIANEALFGIANSSSGNILSPYLRVGTTKDASGNYTFAFNDANVVSRVENNNGLTIRFYDGTQICTKELQWTAPINSAWGGIYASGYISLGNWGYAFLAGTLVHVFPSVANLSGGASAFVGAIKDATQTYAGSLELYRGARIDSPAQLYVKVMAIGRWR